MVSRLFRKRFRIERERGGSAIFKAIEPEPFDQIDHLPGREPGIELAQILSRSRVLLIFFVSL